jgi:hypothetical protein
MPEDAGSFAREFVHSPADERGCYAPPLFSTLRASCASSVVTKSSPLDFFTILPVGRDQENLVEGGDCI